jgi:hypothetical protein
MSRTEILLSLIVVACLVFCSLTWYDNQRLRTELAARECVSQRSHKALLEACEVVTHVNRKQEAIIQKAQEAIGVRYDKIWRAAGDTGPRKDKGLGGGP